MLLRLHPPQGPSIFWVVLFQRHQNLLLGVPTAACTLDIVVSALVVADCNRLA